MFVAEPGVNTMERTSRRSFLTVLMALAIASAGMLAGGLIERYVLWPDERDFSLVRVAWAVDLNNRLHMLRLLREYKAPNDTVREAEISAVALLDTMHVERVSPRDESYSVIVRVLKNLRQYQRDFPSSEFDLKRHPFLGRALEKFSNSESSH